MLWLRHLEWGTGGLFNLNVCKLTTTATAKVKAMRSVKKQTVNALLECSFKTNATMAMVPTATSLTLTMVANNESVVTIAMRATGATARCNSKFCKSKPSVV
jgi:hypothetical protein